MAIFSKNRHGKRDPRKLIALRKELRTQKLWELSDRVRDGLAAVGIVLEDTREGTQWKRATHAPADAASRPPSQDQPSSGRAGGIRPELPKNVRTVFGDDDL